MTNRLKAAWTALRGRPVVAYIETDKIDLGEVRGNIFVTGCKLD